MAIADSSDSALQDEYIDYIRNGQLHAVRDLEVLVLSMKSDTTTKYTIAICVLAWVLVCLGLSVIVWMCLSFCPSLCINCLCI